MTEQKRGDDETLDATTSSTLATTPVQDALSDELMALAMEAASLEEREIEPSSRATYNSYLNGYKTFWKRHRLLPFATSTVKLYVADRVRAGDAFATIKARVAAIKRQALESKLPDPTDDAQLRKILAGAKRSIAKQRRIERVAPIVGREMLSAMLHAIDESTKKDEPLRLRDRAIFLVGFALGRRGAELADLTVADLERRPPRDGKDNGGYLVRFRWSKTNKTGEPEYVGLPAFPGDPLCPVAALDAHLEKSSICAGELFRSRSWNLNARGNPMKRQDISRRVDAIAKRAGLAGRFRSHSFRRGLVTTSEQKNVARSRIRKNTGWKSDAQFSNYAQHDDAIAQSPMHEILGYRVQTLFSD